MKQLKTTASNIQDFTINRSPINPNEKYEMLNLVITLKDSEEIYKYEIFEDRRFTLDYLERVVPQQLKQAIEDFQKVEISEYIERRYLFLKIGKNSQMQVTGERLGRKK